ncbi:MAG: LLM class flavin-dependent oxidoreductase [Xanthobacteraceae bacterium]
MHARVTQQILRADELGYDYAWVAEHHFSSEYGIMPDVFVYAAYLAALTKLFRSCCPNRMRSMSLTSWHAPIALNAAR